MRILTPVSVLLAGVLLGGGACEAAEQPDARFVSIALVSGFDPVDAGDVYAGGAQAQVYDGLLEYHYLRRPVALKPAVAESLPEVSEDGLTWRFRLRDDATFHDSPCFPGGKGRKVTAQDFVWCWKRLVTVPTSQGAWIFEGRIAGLDAWAARARTKLRTLHDVRNEYFPFEHPDMRALAEEPVPGLRAMDDRTLEVVLTEPFPQFAWTLAMSYAVVYPREALEHFGLSFRLRPVGTGPYVVDEYWPFDRKITYVRNPSYREDLYPSDGEPGDREEGLLEDAGMRLPFLDRIELALVEKAQPRWLRFVRGDLDRIEADKDIWEEGMTAEGRLRPDLEAAGIRLQVRPETDVTFTSFNMDDPVIGAPAGERGRRLRQAMSLAYDSSRWIQIMRNGVWAIPAHGPVPPTAAGWVDERSPYAERDLERARRLLAEAGYPGGKGLPPLSYEMTGVDSLNRHGGEILKGCLAEIGIELRLNGQTWDQFIDKVKKRQAQVFGMAWNADYPDAQNFLQLFHGPSASPGPNNSNYSNPEYDALYDRMKRMQPGAERDEVIRAMLRILHEDCPWSYTDHRVKYALSQPWLRNFKYMGMQPWMFKYYRVDAAERTRRRGTAR